MTGKKTDGNHARIREALRKLGAFVWDTHEFGKGFPDLLVVYRRRAVLLELKDPSQPPSARRLTDAEAAFHRDYPGPIAVVETVEQAMHALGIKAVA